MTSMFLLTLVLLAFSVAGILYLWFGDPFTSEKAQDGIIILIGSLFGLVLSLIFFGAVIGIFIGMGLRG